MRSSTGSRARCCLIVEPAAVLRPGPGPQGFELRFDVEPDAAGRACMQGTGGTGAGRDDPSGPGRPRTWLATQRVGYPLHLGRGLYLDRDDRGHCTALLQSASGGLFEGDDVGGRITLAAGARATVAAAAATVVHSMRGGCARQWAVLTAGRGALLEYRPGATILFPRSRLASSIEIRCDERAAVLVTEVVLGHALGDAGPGGDSLFDEYDGRIVVCDSQGRERAAERFRMTGVDWRDALIAGRRDGRVLGSLWLVGHASWDPGQFDGLIDALRQDLSAEGVWGGATLLPSQAGLMLRVLAVDAARLDRVLRAARDRTWRFLRAAAGAPPIRMERPGVGAGL